MKKQEIFDLILTEVADVCNVKVEEIKSKSRRTDIVDARCIAVRYASVKFKLTTRDIATLFGIYTLRNVSRMLRLFYARESSYSFKEYIKALDNKLPIEEVNQS